MRPALATGLIGLCPLVLAAACSRPIQTARTTHAEPPAPAEVEAAARQQARRCGDGWGLLFPGLGQLCLGKTGEGSALMALGAAELGTGIAVGREHGWEHPGSTVPLLGFQDLWVYGNADLYIERALAGQALYAPRDSLADMLAAPFNVQVLGRVEVWAGTLVVLGLGIGATMLLDGVDTTDVGADPNLFGRDFDGRVGYPLGVGIGAGLFGHVAVAEEAVFRGVIQSGLARSLGQRQGWLWGSLVFGLTHSLNALVLPPEDRAEYLLYAVPFITVAGAYLGYAYQRADYSLSVPVAVHFWYDLLLSTTFFVLEPQTSPLSASITIPW
jgi:membrane protease YdiL (CAAX protease family)